MYCVLNYLLKYMCMLHISLLEIWILFSLFILVFLILSFFFSSNRYSYRSKDWMDNINRGWDILETCSMWSEKRYNSVWLVCNRKVYQTQKILKLLKITQNIDNRLFCKCVYCSLYKAVHHIQSTIIYVHDLCYV